MRTMFEPKRAAANEDSWSEAKAIQSPRGGRPDTSTDKQLNRTETNLAN